MINMPDHIAPILSDYEALMAEVKEITKDHDFLCPTFALILAFIGTSEVHPTDLRRRQLYFGVNATYALKNLDRHGFIELAIHRSDRRRKLIKLTPKGLDLAGKLRSALARQKRKVAA